MSFFSIVQYPISSTTTGPFTVPFQYLFSYQVEVRKNGTLLVNGADYTWLTASTLSLVANAVNGDFIDIRRNSMRKADASNGVLVTFTNSAKLAANDLNNEALQAFYLAQEAFDAAANAMQLLTEGKYDAAGKVIKNVANPTLAQDAATKNYVDLTALGSFPSPLAVGSGGTGAATPAVARANLGIDGASRNIASGDLADNAIIARKLAGSAMGFSLINGNLVPSQNGTQLTVAIKTLAGVDPSAADPVYVLFRNVTPGTGDYTVIAITAATSIQTTVAGTFGVANSVPFRLWVVGFNDGGVFRLALINCLTTSANVGSGRNADAIFPLSGWGIASATQIGAGSVLSGTFYSAGAAVGTKAYAALGYLTYEAGLAVAGTFGVNQSRTQLFSQNDSLPGQVIQVQRNVTGAVANASTSIPFDDTIPQSVEGTQYMSQAITPSSAANALKVSAHAQLANAAPGVEYVTVALFQDATANAIAAAAFITSTAETPLAIPLAHVMLAGAAAATTFKIRAGTNSASNMTFNGLASARKLGGVLASYMQAEEIMA